MFANLNVVEMEDKILSMIYPEDFKRLDKNKPSQLYQLGPIISKYKLSNNIFNKMNKIVKDVLKSDDKKRFGHHLAGQIDSEYLIPNEILEKENVLEYFRNVLKCYIRDYFLKQYAENATTKALQSTIDIKTMWIVEQFKHEYNPVHWHENGTISAVMYLKVPEMTNEGSIPGKKNTAGNITFINRSSSGQSLESPLLTVKPEEKDLFIFPASLAHTVYPFDNDVRRLSVSFNSDHNFAGKILDPSNIQNIDPDALLDIVKKIKESDNKE